MKKVIPFQEVLKEINKTEEKNLLIGNGFSVILYDGFHYKNLLETAKSIDADIKINEQLITIFEALKTSDFEKVISYLMVAKKIMPKYSESITQKIISDLDNAKSCFIQSLHEPHPQNQNIFSREIKKNVRSFLSNFTTIFTTNYDLLPYWMIMAKEVKSSRIPKNDGFGYLPYEYPTGDLIWPKKDTVQIFYFLHGALHFFYRTDDGYLTKVKNDCLEGSIMQQISRQINNGKMPLIVFEGTSREKLYKIRKDVYLNYAYESLEAVTGSLVILGHSLNMRSDKHILTAIAKSKVKRIFIGKHDKFISRDASDKLVAANKQVIFFDARTAINWPQAIDE